MQRPRKSKWQICVGIDKKDRYWRKMILGSMYTYNTKLLNKTTVLEKICEARYKRVLEVAGFEDDAIESAKQTKKRIRMSLTRVSKVPPTIFIDTPRIGDVESIRMEVKSQLCKRSKLLMEATSTNFEYIRLACLQELSENNELGDDNVAQVAEPVSSLGDNSAVEGVISEANKNDSEASGDQ